MASPNSLGHRRLRRPELSGFIRALSIAAERSQSTDSLSSQSVEGRITVAHSPSLLSRTREVLSRFSEVKLAPSVSSELESDLDKTLRQLSRLSCKAFQPTTNLLHLPLYHPDPQKLIMPEPKMIIFGGSPGENIEHFLYGFEIFFHKQASTLGDDQAEETNGAKAYYVIRHIKPSSIPSKFVNRLPLGITRNYEALCQEQRVRFENSAKLEEEKRRAEETFLSLRQKSNQSIRTYIRLTRKIASRMSNENQHLVATQFIKGLDYCELRIQAMSGLSKRPSVEEAITKVQRLWDVMGEGRSTGDEEDSEVTDSEMESVEHEGEGRSRGRRANRGKKVREDKKTKKSEQKGLTEAEKIRKELQELKELISKDQGSSFRQGGIPKQVPVPNYQNIPAIEAYAMGNRLAPPVNYGSESRTSYPRYYPGREGRNRQGGDRSNVERANVKQWGPPRQQARPWQELGGYRGG